MQNCGRLREYARFVYEVKQSLSFGMPLERAVNTAIDTCIQQDVLKDILMQSKSEILEMFLTEYDKKLHMENTYREGQEDGLEQGRVQGQNRVLVLYQLLLRENRLDDLRRASENTQYLEELFREFKI